MKDSNRWFATALENDEKLEANEFPSANILALLVQTYCQELKPDAGSENPGKRSVSLNSDNWEILSHTNGKGKIFYQVCNTSSTVAKSSPHYTLD